MRRLADWAVLTACSLLAGCAMQASGSVVPDPPREFRAAWVATVANIDWPSRPGLSPDQQREEAVAILDRLAALRMNAVVFQVRPHADALYASELEPWSGYLTGEQGRAPDPEYDPLSFWCDEAHRRGLQLHAWFNPYRAAHPAQRGDHAPDSLVSSREELVVKLGDKGYYWMDPTLQAVQDHTVAVVTDVVRRYDVDGVHFDDYFYPYPSYNDDEGFPDQASWQRYRDEGGTLDRADWRRDAVDGLIERLEHEIHAVKPHVLFGISPFGIWRPGHPEGIAGFDAYDELYADARRWLREGWVDYLMPQLYWSISKVPQSFPVLLGWWHRQNDLGRHVWPGTNISRMRGRGGATELINQVMTTRGMAPESPGICFFSMKVLQREDDRLGEALVGTGDADQGVVAWSGDALVPASPWLEVPAPASPDAVVAGRLDGGVVRVGWKVGDDVAVPAAQWVVSVQQGSRWSHRVVPVGDRELDVPDSRSLRAVAVRAVGRSGLLSEPKIVELSADEAPVQ